MSINFLTNPERVLDTYNMLTDEEREFMDKSAGMQVTRPILNMYYPNGVKPTNPVINNVEVREEDEEDEDEDEDED